MEENRNPDVYGSLLKDALAQLAEIPMPPEFYELSTKEVMRMLIYNKPSEDGWLLHE